MLKCPLLAAALLLGLLAFGCSTKKQPNNGTDAGAGSAMGPSTPQPDCSADSTDWPMFGQNVCNTASQGSAGGISKDTAPKPTESIVRRS